jgi:hypothetical protein
MQRRKIKLSFVNSGVSVIAEMLDDEAPAICQHVWEMLPVEKPTRHGLYSGQEIFVLLDEPKKLPAENVCQLPLPGELLYFFDDMQSVAYAHKNQISEIVFVYNRGVVLRGAEGVPTYCSLFARIPGDWKYDWTEFREWCRKSRTENPPVLRIERVE